jgi:hypothetical protein
MFMNDKEYGKHWLKLNPDYMREYRQKKKESIRIQRREYRKNKGIPVKAKRSIEEKRKYQNYYSKKYKACKLHRTPNWADLAAIKQFYLNCPEGYEVDHIIPLKGKNVSGLHILENLQYLPASLNRKKSNTFSIA